MPHLSKHRDPGELNDWFRDAHAVTAELLSEVIGETCRRFPSVGQAGKTAQIERLIQSGAWTDAALALIDLELPQWKVRRIAYDGGEWYCALSRERELPGSGAGDLERLRRGATRYCAVKQDQRSHRAARRERAPRTGPDRQFRVKPQTN